jgi:hypothetical protein
VSERDAQTVDELMLAARDRVLAGDLAGARERIEAAAAFWRTRENSAEEARCLRLASSLAAFERAALSSERVMTALSLVDDIAQLQAAGRPDLAERLSDEADRAAAEAGDHASAAQLALLATARALDRGDPQTARVHAERARAEALAGRSAAGYLGAAVALADLAEAAGDRVGAYASLAVGWVTLRDLAGAEGARAAFQPRLAALRQRWGAAEFAVVKAAYEAPQRKTRDGEADERDRQPDDERLAPQQLPVAGSRPTRAPAQQRRQHETDSAADQQQAERELNRRPEHPASRRDQQQYREGRQPERGVQRPSSPGHHGAESIGPARG